MNAGSDTAWVDQVVFTPSAGPEIAVEQPVGTDLTDGSASINFGTVDTGSSSSPFTFTVKNTGTVNLTGLSITKDGTNNTDYAISALGTTTLAPGGSATFTVTFAPGAAGSRTAAIHIASNDADENPFDISLTGTGVIAKASQTINFAALEPVLDNVSSITLTATASSGLAVSYASSNTSVATVSGNTVTIVGAGATTITASQAGDNELQRGQPTCSRPLTVGRAESTRRDRRSLQVVV